MDETIEMARCNACGEQYPEEFIADGSVVDTGGDTICSCCHVESAPDDADEIGEAAEGQVVWMRAHGRRYEGHIYQVRP